MHIEAVLLTGGASRRMGADKASLIVDGVPQAQRIADSLAAAEISVTILGRRPIMGHAFLADKDELCGPLSALSHFEPASDAVFVCSCDLPLFDPRIVSVLANALDNKEAAVPEVEGFRQPLCALYKSSSFASVPDFLRQKSASVMRWLDTLDHVPVDGTELVAAGLDLRCVQGANTRKEFDAMVRLSRQK